MVNMCQRRKRVCNNVFRRKVTDGRASICDLLRQGLGFCTSWISVSMSFICSTCKTLKQLCQDNEGMLFICRLVENPQPFHLRWTGNLLLEQHIAWPILLLSPSWALQWWGLTCWSEEGSLEPCAQVYHSSSKKGALVLFSDFHPLPWVLDNLKFVRLVPGPREVLEQAEVQPEGRVSWRQECSEQTGRLC